MSYYHSKVLTGVSFEEAIEKVTAGLKTGGFGVLTQIDMKATLKAKLDEDIQPYTILGACNPGFAFKALTAEDKIGTMLPCNVIVQHIAAGIEVAAVDPVASMQAVENASLAPIATEVRSKLHRAIDRLE